MKPIVRRSLKLMAALSIAGLAGTFWLAHRAAAEVGESGLALGSELESWSELMGHTTGVEINGQRMRLSSLTTERSPAEIMARFETLCASASTQLTEDLRRANRSFAKPGDEPFLGVLKSDHPSGGGVRACFAQPESLGLSDWTSRLGAFIEHKDLAIFGQLRYVYARPTEGGGTHAIVVHSEGALSLEQMLPARGDAAGGELEGVPRPAQSTRVLSARAVGRSIGVIAYEVPGRPDQALERYRERLTIAGIKDLRVTPDLGAEHAIRGAVDKDGAPLVVQAFEHGDQTLLSVVKLGGPARVQVARGVR